MDEPDLMSAMALVHSRIRRVYFVRRVAAAGALASGWGHIHSLAALNHHYRAFQLHGASLAAAMGGESNPSDGRGEEVLRCAAADGVTAAVVAAAPEDASTRVADSENPCRDAAEEASASRKRKAP